MLFLCRVIFFPLWLFHAVVARGRFSLPAPSVPHDRHVCYNLWSFRNISIMYFFQNCICESTIKYLADNVQDIINLFVLNSGPHAMLWLLCHCLLHSNCFFVYISRVSTVRKKNSFICIQWVCLLGNRPSNLLPIPFLHKVASWQAHLECRRHAFTIGGWYFIH